ncbi:MAG: hypothetical protein KatS3mg002_0518 [Candidatus Woesearchaeota archaeon]|nr:MAG: hypothetical protein KatS3mg002_0518 [Candidatus Woesearchaeota archaeon]
MGPEKFAGLFDLKLEGLNIIRIGKNYYYADEKLIELRSQVKKDVFSVGIYLGSESGKDFYPSPAFIDILSKLDGSDKRKIFVDKKISGLFLYGRNILIDSISKNPYNINSGYVFVQNEEDENLGYGVFQKQGMQIVIKNLLDKGVYLRKESKKKK